MLYRFVRPLAKLGIRANYQHIFLSNTDRIPKDKPVILAANHPTAFMEPCILACFLDRPLFFLVRGDFFLKPFYSFLLRQLNMLPLFRMRDGGYTKLKNNFATFDDCSKALNANKTIMILAEGRTIHEKRLRPIQKGTGRIALGTLERYPDIENVYIVPVGVNYTYAEKSRTTVMIDFGPPMSARDYLEVYEDKPNVAINQLTEDLTKALAERVINIEPEDEELTEYFFRLHRSENPLPIFPVIKTNEGPLFEEKRIADQIKNWEKSDKKTLRQALKNYFDRLKQLGFKDETIVGKNYFARANTAALLLGFIPFLLGYLWNFIPLQLAKFIADSQIDDITFYAPVKWAVGNSAYLIWSIIWLVILVLNKWYLAITALILLALTGYFSVYYQEFFEKWRQSRKWIQIDEQLKRNIRLERSKLTLKTNSTL